jgi:outer membrane lipoprotein-sorting protein
MNRVIIVLLLAGFLGACAGEDAIRIAKKVMCDLGSVASIEQEFGQTQERAEAWYTLCHPAPGMRLIGPTGDE